jgi:hypothetical protein
MRIQFNLRSILLQKFQRNFENWAEGQDISVPLHAGRTGGYGFSPTGQLPPADAQEVARANFNYARMYGRIQIDAAHIKGASKSYAAEARPYNLETRSLVKQLRSTLNFHLFGSGTGQLTLLPSQTATFSSPTATITVSSIKGLHKNQMVDLLLIADGTFSGTNGFKFAQIASINKSTKVVTITLGTPGDTTWDPTHFNANEALYALYQSLKGDTSSYGNVFNGLQSACGTTGTYGGINRATVGNEYWHGQAIDAGAATDPWLALLEEAIDLVEIHSDGQVDLMVTTHEIWAHLMNHLVAQKRYTGDMKINGWCRALDFNGIPIVRDKHCPDGLLFALDTSTFTIFQDSEGGWMDEDGAVLHRVTDVEAYEATWSRYLELVCDQPAANCIISDLIAAYPTADFVAPASGA